MRATDPRGPLALLLAAGLLAGCGGHRHGSSPDEVFEAHCRRCHGEDGRSAWASEVAGHPVDLRDPDFQANTSDDEIREIVQQGYEDMEAIGLPPAELDSVVVQLRRLGSR